MNDKLAKVTKEEMLLLFDEATSSLDLYGERMPEICEAIKRLIEGQAEKVLAHTHQIIPIMTKEEAEQMVEWADEHIEWRKQKMRKPTHGTCCTCQECGQPHDECMCRDMENFKLVKQVWGENG